MRGAAGRMAALAGGDAAPGEAQPVPRVGVLARRRLAGARGGRGPPGGRWCRSCSTARCCSPTTRRRSTRWPRRWRRRGSTAVPVFVPSLRDAGRRRGLEPALRRLAPAALVTATAFAASEGSGTLFDRLGVPVLQVVPATTRREAWEGGPARAGAGRSGDARRAAGARRAGPGRGGVVQGTVERRRFGTGLQVNRAEPDRVAQVARRIAALAAAAGDAAGGAAAGDADPGLSGGGGADRLCGRARRAGERAGDARGPARRRATAVGDGAGDGARPDAAAGAGERRAGARRPIARQGAAGGDGGLGRAGGGCAGGHVPVPGRAVRQRRRGAGAGPGAERGPAGRLPRPGAAAAACAASPSGSGCARRSAAMRWCMSARTGRSSGCRERPWRCRSGCFPEVVAGALPVVYPFIVSNPGEAAQAKRRIAAVTLGHLTPPLVGAGSERGAARRWSGWSTSMPRRTGSTGGGATGWRG